MCASTIFTAYCREKELREGLESRVAELEQLLKDQLLTIQALTAPAEEATGKSGSSALVLYIARLESRVEDLERVLQLTIGYLSLEDVHERYAFEQARRLLR